MNSLFYIIYITFFKLLLSDRFEVMLLFQTWWFGFYYRLGCLLPILKMESAYGFMAIQSYGYQRYASPANESSVLFEVPSDNIFMCSEYFRHNSSSRNHTLMPNYFSFNKESRICSFGAVNETSLADRSHETELGMTSIMISIKGKAFFEMEIFRN